MTTIFSEANFNTKDVFNFLNDVDYDISDLSHRYRNQDRIGYSEVNKWLSEKSSVGKSKMIMRKMECECVGYIDELHI